MRFDLNQFRAQLDQIDVDSIHDLMFKIPCSGQMGTDDLVLDVQSKLKQLKGVIDSMTSAERRDPGLIELSRRRRIAEGSAADPIAVSILSQQFDQMAELIRAWQS